MFLFISLNVVTGWLYSLILSVFDLYGKLIDRKKNELLQYNVNGTDTKERVRTGLEPVTLRTTQTRRQRSKRVSHKHAQEQCTVDTKQMLLPYVGGTSRLPP